MVSARNRRGHDAITRRYINDGGSATNIRWGFVGQYYYQAAGTMLLVADIGIVS